MFLNVLRLFLLILISSVIFSLGLNFDHDFVYFEILEPSDVSYTFRTRASINFGTRFDQLWTDVYLVPSRPFKACSRLENHGQIRGNVVLAERGECSFITKALSALEAGAIAVIIMDHIVNSDDEMFRMTGDKTQRTVDIPALFLQNRDGRMILNSIEKNHLIGVRINIPLNLTYEEILKANRAPGSSWL